MCCAFPVYVKAAGSQDPFMEMRLHRTMSSERVCRFVSERLHRTDCTVVKISGDGWSVPACLAVDALLRLRPGEKVEFSFSDAFSSSLDDIDVSRDSSNRSSLCSEIEEKSCPDADQDGANQGFVSSTLYEDDGLSIVQPDLTDMDREVANRTASLSSDSHSVDSDRDTKEHCVDAQTFRPLEAELRRRRRTKAASSLLL